MTICWTVAPEPRLIHAASVEKRGTGKAGVVPSPRGGNGQLLVNPCAPIVVRKVISQGSAPNPAHPEEGGEVAVPTPPKAARVVNRLAGVIRREVKWWDF